MSGMVGTSRGAGSGGRRGRVCGVAGFAIGHGEDLLQRDELWSNFVDDEWEKDGEVGFHDSQLQRSELDGKRRSPGGLWRLSALDLEAIAVG